MNGISSLLLRAASLVAALSLVSFTLAEWTPGDYLSTLRLDPSLSSGTIEAIRSRLGMDRPWPERYLRWCVSALHGDFGVSLAYGIPVRRLLADRLPATLWLNLLSTLCAWAAALALGAAAARRAGSVADRAIQAMQAMLLGLPEILLALLGLWLFGGHPMLPYAVLTLGALPVLLVHARAGIRSALGHTAVRAARLHGVTGARLWWSYVLPLAAPPLVTLAGLSFGGLSSASLLVEGALGVPGVGSLLLEAIQARDTAVVAAVVLLSGLLLMSANVAADAARRAIDPRLRANA